MVDFLRKNETINVFYNIWTTIPTIHGIITLKTCKLFGPIIENLHQSTEERNVILNYQSTREFAT
jgi:hypothetical protein